MSQFINRATTQANRGKQLYYVSSIEATNLTIKAQFSQAISQAKIDDLSLIPLNSKIQQRGYVEFLTERIFNVGIYEQHTVGKGLKAENTKEANFLFYDLEHKQGATTTQLSFTDTIKILEANELNFILTTSFSHTEEDPRLHLFIPLYRAIKSPEEYKYNWLLFKEEYLDGYSLDESTKNINRWVYPAKKETLQVATEFSKNDYIVSKMPEIVRAITNEVESKGRSYEQNPKALKLFNEQVTRLHRFNYERFDSNGVIKYKRDNEDKTANVFISTQVNNTQYNQYTIYDKKDPYNTLFSYDDYTKALDPFENNLIKVFRSAIAHTVENLLSNPSPRYLITNEGLGKSTSILNLGHRYKFIFAVHTRVRAKEISAKLKAEGIPFTRILNNEEIILKATNDAEIAEAYKNYQSEQKDELTTLKNFLKANKTDPQEIEKIIDLYDQNINDLKDTSKVRIVTTRKLQIEIQRAIRAGLNNFTDHFIIFDEFIFTEWSKIKAATKKELVRGDFKEQKSLWGRNATVKFTENKDSFLKLLEKSNKLLILTTERELIEPLLSGTKFKELHPEYDLFNQVDIEKFEQKLLAPNVFYILVNSTRAELRADLVTALVNHYNVDLIISNKIQNGSYSSNFIDIGETRIPVKAHAGVKGINGLEDTTTLVLGTLADELHVNLVYYACELYFLTKNLTEKALGEDIQSRILTTTINQSIGRNQGFRAKDKNTMVVLPLIQNGKSKKNFKTLTGLNYVTANVIIRRTENILAV